MKHIKNISIAFLISAFTLSNLNFAKSQDTTEETQEIQETQGAIQEVIQEELQNENTNLQKKKGFFLFRKNGGLELREKHRKELQELREKQDKEKEELRKELKEKAKKDRNLEEKTFVETKKNTLTAREEIQKRTKEIRETRKSKRSVEILTSKDDPLYILDADVLNSKTQFLKVKNVEFKYKLKLHNQTPKIINTALIIWERRIPFTESLTITRETKISKPIIPYEKRIVEYNDLDSKREGETYIVKVAKIIFEDGTQWTNSL